MNNISIILPVQAWNIILSALGQRPYAEVIELVTEIKKQGEAQVNAAPQEPTEE